MSLNQFQCSSRSWHLKTNIYLIVSVGFCVPLENFSLVWQRHNCRWRAANSYLCSALMAIEQWGFFSEPSLLWHRISVYNVHLRGPVNLTFSSGAVTTCFCDLGLSQLVFEHPTFRMLDERSNHLCRYLNANEIKVNSNKGQTPF